MRWACFDFDRPASSLVWSRRQAESGGLVLIYSLQVLVTTEGTGVGREWTPAAYYRRSRMVEDFEWRRVERG